MSSLLIIPSLLLIEAFYSGSEIALLTADRIQLKAQAKRGDRKSRWALKLIAHPERILAATLLITSLCVLGNSSLITLIAMQRYPEHAELVSLLVASPLIVVFGELIPKTIFQRFATQIAPWISLPVLLVYWVCYPITRLLSAYTGKLSKALAPLEELTGNRRKTKRDELVTVFSGNFNGTGLRSSEQKFIKRILDFKDSEAKHALIPLIKVDAIEDKSTAKQALERFKKHRHSRMPVYQGRVDNIVGVLELSDLANVTDFSQPIKDLMGAAHYVPETQSLRDLLLAMHREDNQMVIVVDEYGGAVGVITYEDIVEEIVGELNDEFDTETDLFREIHENAWMVQARMEITEINERLRLQIPEGEYDTLAGFLLNQFGRIPEIGDELYFDTPDANLHFVVRKSNIRQIELVRIERVSLRSDQDDTF